jgi:hypothetical protein
MNKNKDSLKNVISRLADNFGLTPWDMVESVISNIYWGDYGETRLTWFGGQAASGCRATINIKGGRKNNEGCASIKWLTSSGHKVEFVLKTDSTRRWRGEKNELWKFSKICIGGDPSEFFYPIIHGIAQECDIPFVKKDIRR